MDSIQFNITNNAWVNNGLVRLIIELKDKFEEDIIINRKDNAVVIYSKTDNSVEYYLNEILFYLATFGTFNFSQVFKIINKHLNYSFLPPCPFPKNPDDLKENIEVLKDIRDEIKKIDKNIDIKSKNQIWKRRLSVIFKSNDFYFKYGLNFKKSSEYNKLINNINKNNICPICGSISKEMIDIKQSINPLSNEHHNNKIDGIGSLRLKNKFCPKCYFLSLISVFDKYIPFYSNEKNQVFLALPNIYNLEILEKIASNLSLKSQYIDLSDENVTKYNKNIVNFNNLESNSAALLCLLNNIQNNFSLNQVNDIFQVFLADELMGIVDWIFLNKDSFSINRIKANNNVYKILKPQYNKKGEEFYLVNDVLNKINFNGMSIYKIEKFFRSFLDLDVISISNSLFELVKFDVKFYNIYLFKELFLNQIFGDIMVLNEDYKKACKSIAETIGKSFYQDIGLLSKFAYSTDDNIFKEYIEEAFFLMAKKSALNSEITYSNGKELDILFDELDESNFRETKSYFVSFMSSSALYTKFKNNKNSEGDN